MSNIELTGNKGEWSEIYVFFRLLADGELYAADSNLEKIASIYYPIIKIIRDEISGKWDYYRNSKIIIKNAETQEVIEEIPISEFKKKTQILLKEIKESNKRTFSVASVQKFMSQIKCGSIKANPQEKRDITIMVHDLRTGFNTTLGFSIKSQLGGASTLLNAGKTTNFTFKIRDLAIDDKKIQEINEISSRSKIRDRLSLIQGLGGELQFYKMDNNVFELNLRLIDSQLPEIVANLLLYYFMGDGTKSKDLIKFLRERNPCGYNFDQSHPFYEYKIKNLLSFLRYFN